MHIQKFCLSLHHNKTATKNKHMKAAELKDKKITMATLKSFINKAGVLFAEVKSSFDGMTDGIERNQDPKLVEVSKENAIGHEGVWCVGGGRDYFTFQENATHYGIEVYNSCGTGILWTLKENSTNQINQISKQSKISTMKKSTATNKTAAMKANIAKTKEVKAVNLVGKLVRTTIAGNPDVIGEVMSQEPTNVTIKVGKVKHIIATAKVEVVTKAQAKEILAGVVKETIKPAKKEKVGADDMDKALAAGGKKEKTAKVTKEKKAPAPKKGKAALEAPAAEENILDVTNETPEVIPPVAAPDAKAPNGGDLVAGDHFRFDRKNGEVVHSILSIEGVSVKFQNTKTKVKWAASLEWLKKQRVIKTDAPTEA